MRPDKLLTGLVLALLSAGLFAGCKAENDAGPVPTPAPQYESTKAVVKFKRNERLRTDFANTLGVPEAELCKELGLYSCTDAVHSVSLGAVAPYSVGLYEALPRTGVATPIIVDRVALAGCAQRVDLDFATPTAALVFGGLQVGANGHLLDLQAPSVTESVDTLYRRALRRHATAEEIGNLKQLYVDTEAAGSPAAARDWAVLSCFAVLTTLESVFY